jgi:hypothetical protein
MAVPCVLRLRQDIDKFAGGIIDEGRMFDLQGAIGIS